jgi:hypothetical protein
MVYEGPRFTNAKRGADHHWTLQRVTSRKAHVE